MTLSKIRRRISGSATDSLTRRSNVRLGVDAHGVQLVRRLLRCPSARHASGDSGCGSAPRPPVPSASASRGAGSIVQHQRPLPAPRGQRAHGRRGAWSCPRRRARRRREPCCRATSASIIVPDADEVQASADAHQQRGDVVGAAGLVGGVDQQLAGRLDVVGRFEDACRSWRRAPSPTARRCTACRGRPDATLLT